MSIPHREARRAMEREEKRRLKRLKKAEEQSTTTINPPLNEMPASLTQEGFLLMKGILIDCYKKLKGRDRRIFAAQLALALGNGGQVFISDQLHIGRNTIRKAIGEIKSGIPIIDQVHLRHRKRIEEHLPNLLIDMQSICDSQSQTDPTFKSTRLYTRLSAVEIRRQLIEKKGYTDEQLPTIQTLNTKLNELGYRLKKVQKTKPLKKLKKLTQSLTK